MKHVCVARTPYCTQADQEIWVATGLMGSAAYKTRVLIKMLSCRSFESGARRGHHSAALHESASGDTCVGLEIEAPRVRWERGAQLLTCRRAAYLPA